MLSAGFDPGGAELGRGPGTDAWWSAPFQRTLGWSRGTPAAGQHLEVLGVGQYRERGLEEASGPGPEQGPKVDGEGHRTRQ